MDCSQFLLLSTGGLGNTSELGAVVELRFMLADTPLHDVMCPLAVYPPTEAELTPFRLDFARENASKPIAVAVRGTRDWKTEPDRKYEVRVGSCISNDPRFHGIGYPQAPAVTALHLVNKEVSFPLISSVEPMSVRPTGTLVTVSGTLFAPDARMFVAGYVLADLQTYPFVNISRKLKPLSRRRVPKRWVLLNNTARNRVQPIEMAALARMGVSYTGENTTFHDEHYNDTVCSIMADLNLTKNPNASDSAGVDNFDAEPDLELSDLVGFRWLRTAAGVYSSVFVTPCVPVAERARAVLLTVVLPDSRLRSPAAVDLAQQAVDGPTVGLAVYRPTDACLVPPYVVLAKDGECERCPEGAECPGEGRIWPKRGYWNEGELSGHVGRCNPESRCAGWLNKTVRCTPGYTAEYCSKCDARYYLMNGYCLPCLANDVTKMRLANNAFLVGAIIATLVLPTILLTYCYKLFVGVSSVLSLAGKISTDDDTIRQLLLLLKLFNFDIEARQPGCEDTAKIFLDIWRSSLVLIAQYSLPSLALVLSLYAMLKLALGAFDRLNPCVRSKHLRARRFAEKALAWLRIRSATVRAPTQARVGTPMRARTRARTHALAHRSASCGRTCCTSLAAPSC